METLRFINGHPTKRALICFVLLQNGPMTRIPLMKAVHALESSKRPFRKTSNICYFSRDKYKNPWCRNDFSLSVLIPHGEERPALARKVVVRNRFHVYGLTEAGYALAVQAQKHYGLKTT
jgi:hypothetical protein